MSAANKSIKVLTKMIEQCANENHPRFGWIKHQEVRALDELVYSVDADVELKLEFWGAVVDYNSKMVTHGKY